MDTETARPAPKLLASCYELVEVLCSAVLAIALMFTFAVRFAGVNGTSMAPTLKNSDWLAITAALPSPKHGDIVIISPRTNAYHEPLVKRIVALEGDTIDIRDGRVWVNGAMTDEPYLPPDVRTEPAPWGEQSVELPALVPAGDVFVMGDNRGHSADSRFSVVGFIREDDILGRVLFRLYSKDPDERFHFKVK